MSAVTALAGGVFGTGATDDDAELRDLVDEIGRQSFEARQGRGRPDDCDIDGAFLQAYRIGRDGG